MTLLEHSGMTLSNQDFVVSALGHLERAFQTWSQRNPEERNETSSKEKNPQSCLVLSLCVRVELRKLPSSVPSHVLGWKDVCMCVCVEQVLDFSRCFHHSCFRNSIGTLMFENTRDIISLSLSLRVHISNSNRAFCWLCFFSLKMSWQSNIRVWTSPFTWAERRKASHLI